MRKVPFKALLKNLFNLAKHKYFVYKAGRKLDVPVRQLLVHDLSKLLPSELIPYTLYFYCGGKNKTEIRAAWRLHYFRNPHHWQNWIVIDADGIHTLQIPDVYVREMVADWWGAGRAKNNKVDLLEWYEKNGQNILLHTESRGLVEEYIKELLNGREGNRKRPSNLRRTISAKT